MLTSLSISVPIQIAIVATAAIVTTGTVVVWNRPAPTEAAVSAPQTSEASTATTEPSQTAPVAKVAETVAAPKADDTPVVAIVEAPANTLDATVSDTVDALPDVQADAQNSVVALATDLTAPNVQSGPEAVAVETPEHNPVKPLESAPRFDLVRVDTSGSAVIAGTAEPGAEVQVTLGDAPVETVRADRNGAFVALFQIPEGDAPQTVGLQQLVNASTVVTSAQTVLVVPPPIEEAEAVPTIVLADAEGAEVLQPSLSAGPNSLATHPLSLEAISYDQGGAVVLAGRGSGDKFVRVYVDNRAVETEPVPDDGNWRVTLPQIDQGVYTLRVDEISDTGDVLSRVESPFKREAPAELAAAAEVAPGKSSVVVQPGHTLWALAQDQYGDGVKYVQIFHANRERIRNANLIYPGQVFDLPE